MEEKKEVRGQIPENGKCYCERCGKTLG